MVLPILVLLVGQLLYAPLTFAQILLGVSKSANMLQIYRGHLCPLKKPDILPVTTTEYCKKRLAVFQSPAGNNQIIPVQGEFGK
jgi:hypothetical protein